MSLRLKKNTPPLTSGPAATFHASRRPARMALMASAALTVLFAASPAVSAVINGTNPPTVVYDNQTIYTPSGALVGIPGSVFYATGAGNSIVVQHTAGGTGIVLNALNSRSAGDVHAGNNGFIDLGSGATINGSGFGTSSVTFGNAGIYAQTGGRVIGDNVTMHIASDGPRGIYVNNSGHVNLTGLTTIDTQGRSSGNGLTWGAGVWGNGGSGGTLDLVDLDMVITGYSGTYSTQAYGIYALDIGTVNVTGTANVDITGQSVYSIYSRAAGSILNLNSLTLKATSTSGVAAGFWVDTQGVATAAGAVDMTIDAKTTGYGMYVYTGGTLSVGGPLTFDITANSGYVATVSGAASSLTLSDISGTFTSRTVNAIGFQVANGTATVNGNIDITLNAAARGRGINIGNDGKLTGSGFARFTITGSGSSNDGISVTGGGQVTLSGGSDFSITGPTVYGLFLDHNGVTTAQPFVKLTNATMNLNGSSTAISIYADESAATTYNMQVDITGSTFNSSGSGVVLTQGKLDLSLTNSTMNNAGDIAFDVGSAAAADLTAGAAGSTFNGSATTAAGSTFNLTMTSGSDWSDAWGNLTNLTLNDSALKFAAPAGGAFHTLTTEQNYTASNGHVHIYSQLGNDASPTDLLHVKGNTSGNTTLHVTNAAGGGGGTTGDGIRVVEVNGTSGGAFVLQGDYITASGDPAVIGGAFAYTLWKDSKSGPDGHWYLRSEIVPPDPPPPGINPNSDGTLTIYQPAAPVVEGQPRVLVETTVADMETYRQRIDMQYHMRHGGGLPAPLSAYVPVSTGAIDSSLLPVYHRDYENDNATYSWVRVRGSRSSYTPAKSTTSVSKVASTDWEIKTGIDGAMLMNEHDTLVAGVHVLYGGSRTESKSYFGNGGIDSERYGLGATLTWYNDVGTYIDTVAEFIIFSNDIRSDTLGRLYDHHNSYSWAFSIEGGQEFKLNANWGLTPQIQLVWGRLDFGKFIDRYHNPYTASDTNSLRGRLGVALDHHDFKLDERGVASWTRGYGIANLYYEFLEGTTLNIDGDLLNQEYDRLWGGVGLGASHDWEDGKYRLFTEVEAKTSLQNFGDSWNVSGRVGFIMRW